MKKASSFFLGLAVALLFAAAASLGMSNAEEAANIAFADLVLEKYLGGVALIFGVLSIIARLVGRLVSRVHTRKMIEMCTRLVFHIIGPRFISESGGK